MADTTHLLIEKNFSTFYVQYFCHLSNIPIYFYLLICTNQQRIHDNDLRHKIKLILWWLEGTR